MTVLQAVAIAAAIWGTLVTVYLIAYCAGRRAGK